MSTAAFVAEMTRRFEADGELARRFLQSGAADDPAALRDVLRREGVVPPGGPQPIGPEDLDRVTGGGLGDFGLGPQQSVLLVEMKLIATSLGCGEGQDCACLDCGADHGDA
jgi:hypothetical protein